MKLLKALKKTYVVLSFFCDVDSIIFMAIFLTKKYIKIFTIPSLMNGINIILKTQSLQS